MKLKRLIALFALLSLLCSLCACVAQPAEPAAATQPAQTTPVTTAATEPTEEAKPYGLTPLVENGRYVYNPHLLSQESIDYMGEGFAPFFASFVDAFLNYEPQCYCPDSSYAEMLSTIIYYDFPLYTALAEPFEYFRHYNPETGMATITYRYDRPTHDAIKAQLIQVANNFLAATGPENSDIQNARAIYHALSGSITYDHSALEIFERKESYYAYLYGTGVCITFANAYNQMLTQVGIQATLASCDVPNDVGHIWSLVTLDGQQYFCDPTYEISYDEGQGYRFFGMTYAQRTADGLGQLGIYGGRYLSYLMTEDMLSPQPLAP